MNKNQLVALIDALITSGKTIEALNAMGEYVKDIDNYLSNDIILQKAAYNRNARDFRSGLMSRANYDLGMAKLNYAITQLKDSLPAQGNAVSQQKPHNNNNGGHNGTHDTTNNTSKKRTILFLSANPNHTGELRLDREERKIRDILSTTTHKDSFKFINEPAVQVEHIAGVLQREKTEIIHFSGHGEGEEGIVIEDEYGDVQLLTTRRLNHLFGELKEGIQCVILSACYSKVQAEVISKHNLYVVGMNRAIKDKEATRFAKGFYQSLGEGGSYERAFKMGLFFIDDEESVGIPELWFNGKCIQ